MKKLTLRFWVIVFLSISLSFISPQGNAIVVQENDLHFRIEKFDTDEVSVPNAADIWIALRDSGKLLVDDGDISMSKIMNSLTTLHMRNF